MLAFVGVIKAEDCGCVKYEQILKEYWDNTLWGIPAPIEKVQKDIDVMTSKGWRVIMIDHSGVGAQPYRIIYEKCIEWR